MSLSFTSNSFTGMVIYSALEYSHSRAFPLKHEPIITFVTSSVSRYASGTLLAFPRLRTYRFVHRKYLATQKLMLYSIVETPHYLRCVLARILFVDSPQTLHFDSRLSSASAATARSLVWLTQAPFLPVLVPSGDVPALSAWPHITSVVNSQT